MRYLLVLISFHCFLNLQAQNKALAFSFEHNEEEFKVGKMNLIAESTDSFFIDKIRFYVSDITYWNQGEMIYQVEKRFHLIDLVEDNKISVFTKEDFEADSLSFNIGVDSLTNVSGAHGDDLDPSHGMYWTWNSGYINFKLEGRSNVCLTRKNKFQFHIGGFQAPYESMRSIGFRLETFQSINVVFNVDAFLENIDLRSTSTIMSPGEGSVKIANGFKDCFTITDLD